MMTIILPGMDAINRVEAFIGEQLRNTLDMDMMIVILFPIQYYTNHILSRLC